MSLLEVHFYHSQSLRQQLLWKKMASNQGWDEERLQTRKKVGGI
jgi:hypothetical protein